jgi:hypothetical protein
MKTEEVNGAFKVVSNFQASSTTDLEIAGQLEEAIEQRWRQYSANRYASPHRAVADLTRDGEGILEAAGREGVPPYPGCLKLGGGQDSSTSSLRLYRCTTVTRNDGDRPLVLDLEVKLAPANGDHDLALEEMLNGCPEIRVISPGDTRTEQRT